MPAWLQDPRLQPLRSEGPTSTSMAVHYYPGRPSESQVLPSTTLAACESQRKLLKDTGPGFGTLALQFG